MKKLLIILAVCGVCFAIESPVTNTRGTVSSNTNGLIRSPNPVNLNGNDVITGNVRGGKEFRGVVPYISPSSIHSTTATDSFTNFLRQTSPQYVGNRYQSASPAFLPQPYYIPTQTVTSLNTRQGAPGLQTYSSIRDTHGTGDYTPPVYSKTFNEYQNPKAYEEAQQYPVTQNEPEYQYTLSRPLSFTNPLDLEKIVNNSLPSQQEQKELTATLNQIRIQQQQQENKQQTEDEQKQAEENKLQEQTNEDSGIATPAERAEPEKPLEPIKPLERGQVPKQVSAQDKNKNPYEQLLEQQVGKPKARAEANQPKEANEPKKKEEIKEESRHSKLAEVDEETAQVLKGINRTFATESKTKFNSYMKKAEIYLHNGDYYKAADAYTLASIYNPQAPLAYAGRAHALFATGEYMSSSYYLMRAINMMPQYADAKIDLHAMIPDKDKLDSRISDINKWNTRNKSPELEFLLAYLYHQLDKPTEAANMINDAAKELPDNKAVLALKEAIEKK